MGQSNFKAQAQGAGETWISGVSKKSEGNDCNVRSAPQLTTQDDDGLVTSSPTRHAEPQFAASAFQTAIAGIALRGLSERSFDGAQFDPLRISVSFQSKSLAEALPLKAEPGFEQEQACKADRRADVQCLAELEATANNPERSKLKRPQHHDAPSSVKSGVCVARFDWLQPEGLRGKQPASNNPYRNCMSSHAAGNDCVGFAGQDKARPFSELSYLNERRNDDTVQQQNQQNVPQLTWKSRGKQKAKLQDYTDSTWAGFGTRYNVDTSAFEDADLTSRAIEQFQDEYALPLSKDYNKLTFAECYVGNRLDVSRSNGIGEAGPAYPKLGNIKENQDGTLSSVWSHKAGNGSMETAAHLSDHHCTSPNSSFPAVIDPVPGVPTTSHVAPALGSEDHRKVFQHIRSEFDRNTKKPIRLLGRAVKGKAGPIRRAGEWRALRGKAIFQGFKELAEPRERTNGSHWIDADTAFSPDTAAKSVEQEVAGLSPTRHLTEEELARLQRHEAAATTTTSSQSSECVVCGDTKDRLSFPPNPPTSSCTHASETCTSCVQAWTSSQLETKSWRNIHCPQCPSALSHAEMRTASTGEAFARFDALALRSTLGGLVDFAWCLRPSCGFGQENIEPDQGVGAFMECQKCGFRQCVQHKGPWHEGVNCEVFEAKTGAARKAREAEMQSKRWLLGNSQRCPGKRCGVWIEKLEGCDHMTCRKCWTAFCYQCRAKYRDIRVKGNEAHAKDCMYYSQEVYPH